MTDANKGATGTLADPVTQPPAGTPTTQADGGTEATHVPESISLDDARKLRSEARQLRERNRALEDEKRARDEAALSETEKSARRIAQLEQALAERDARTRDKTLAAATVDAAARLGFANPRLALRMIEAADVEYDGDGEPTNVENLLKSLLKAEPYLAASHARPTGSIDGGTRGAPGLTLEEINRMGPEEYEKRRPEVMSFLGRR